MHRWTEFAEVTADALDFALDEAGVEDHDLRRDLLDAYRSLECYPEVTRVLDALRDGGRRTAILSNGSPRDARRGGSRAQGSGAGLDAVLSVDDVHVLQAAPGRVRPRVHPARGATARGLLPVIERLGRGGGGHVRVSGGLGESLRPGAGSSSPTPRRWRSRPSTRSPPSSSASVVSLVQCRIYPFRYPQVGLVGGVTRQSGRRVHPGRHRGDRPVAPTPTLDE